MGDEGIRVVVRVSGVGDKFCDGAMENWGKWDGRIYPGHGVAAEVAQTRQANEKIRVKKKG